MGLVLALVLFELCLLWLMMSKWLDLIVCRLLLSFCRLVDIPPDSVFVSFRFVSRYFVLLFALV